jgi:hypothetical protein
VQLHYCDASFAKGRHYDDVIVGPSVRKNIFVSSYESKILKGCHSQLISSTQLALLMRVDKKSFARGRELTQRHAIRGDRGAVRAGFIEGGSCYFYP